MQLRVERTAVTRRDQDMMKMCFYQTLLMNKETCFCEFLAISEVNEIQQARNNV
jgi:hypothetical protein